jgi:phenylalanyl-tRNA synthetase beta chain
VAQPLMLAGAAWGGPVAEQWAAPKRAVDFYDVKADLAAVLPGGAAFVKASHPLLHPGRSARIEYDGKVLGWLGELNPTHLGAFDLNLSPLVFELFAAELQSLKAAGFEAVSKQPSVRRDIAFVVPNSVDSDALLTTLRAAASPIVRSIDVFDVYRGSGVAVDQKSVAIRVLMQHTERTLEDVEVDLAVSKLVKSAEEKLEATLRA